MTSTLRNIPEAMLAPWKALPEEQRAWVLREINDRDPQRMNGWRFALDAALLVLRAAAEPEAKPAEDNGPRPWDGADWRRCSTCAGKVVCPTCLVRQ